MGSAWSATSNNRTKPGMRGHILGLMQLPSSGVHLKEHPRTMEFGITKTKAITWHGQGEVTGRMQALSRYAGGACWRAKPHAKVTGRLRQAMRE